MFALFLGIASFFLSNFLGSYKPIGMLKQVNVALEEGLARRIKADAASLGIPLNEYGRLAFEQFISKSVASRRVNAGDAKRKTVGRKLQPA